MSIYESTPARSVPLGSITIFTAIAGIERMAQRLVDWRRARSTAARLDALTDLQLKDIGVDRSEIARVSRSAGHL